MVTNASFQRKVSPVLAESCACTSGFCDVNIQGKPKLDGNEVSDITFLTISSESFGRSSALLFLLHASFWGGGSPVPSPPAHLPWHLAISCLLCHCGTCNVGSPSFSSFISDFFENQTTVKCRQWPKCAKTLQILPCSCPPGLPRSSVANTRASQQAQHLAHPRLAGGQKDLPQHPQKLTSKVSTAGPQAAPRSRRGWHRTNTKRENGSCSAEAVAKIKQIRNKNEKGER